MSDIGFGLHINERFTRICDYRLVNGKIEIAAMGSERTHPTFFNSDNDPNIENQAAIIKRLCSSLHITKSNAHVVIPDSFTFSQIVEMPKLKEKELLAAIRYQADEFIPMPIEETNLDLEILREDDKTNKTQLLIVASPKKLAIQLDKTLTKADLVGESLENELSAIGRLANELEIYKNETVLVFNLGYSSSSIYLLDGRTGILLLARTLKIGWELFIKDIKVNLNISEDKAIEVLQKVGIAHVEELNIEAIIMPIVDELLREIEKITIMTKDKYGLSLNKIVVFNFDSQIAHLREKIQTRFSLPVESFNIAKFILSSPTVQNFAAEITSFVPVIASALR